MNSNSLKFTFPSSSEKPKILKGRLDEDILNRLKSFLTEDADKDSRSKSEYHLNKKRDLNKFIQFSPNNEIMSGSKVKSIKSEMKVLYLPKLEVDDDLIQIFSEDFNLFHNSLKAIIEGGNRSQFLEENPFGERIYSLVKEYVIRDKSRMEEKLELCKSLLEENPNYRSYIEYLKTYIIVYIFFEYFIIFSNDIIHLLNIRNDLMKYCLSGDLQRLSLFSAPQEYSENLSILFEKVTMSVKICDFEKLTSLCEILSENFQRVKNPAFQSCYLDLKTIFNCFTTIFRGYRNLLENKGNMNEKYKNDLIKKNTIKIKECRDSIDEVRKLCNNDKIEEVIRFSDYLLNIISGNLHAIKKISTDIYQKILMYVYFVAIYENDKSELNISGEPAQDKLKELREFMIDNQLDDEMFILNSAIIDNPFVFSEKLRNHFPFYINFQITTYLYHLELIPHPTSYSDLYNEFMEGLMTKDFPLKISLNYYNFFDSDPRTENMVLDYLCNKWIVNLFKKAQNENYSDINNLLKDIESTVASIKHYSNSRRIELSIYYYCGMKFYEARMYDLGVKYIYKEMGDRVMYKFFANKIVEQFLNLEDKDLIYSEGNEKENYFETLLRIDKNTLNQLSELKFLIKYQGILNIYEHLRNGRNYYTDMKIKKKVAKFFNFAFVQNKCPKLLFIRTAGLFQRLFSDFKEVFKGVSVEEVNCASVAINEKLIKYEIKKFLEKLKKNKEYSGYNEKSIEDSYQNIDQNLCNAIDFFYNLENYLTLLN